MKDIVIEIEKKLSEGKCSIDELKLLSDEFSMLKDESKKKVKLLLTLAELEIEKLWELKLYCKETFNSLVLTYLTSTQAKNLNYYMRFKKYQLFMTYPLINTNPVSSVIEKLSIDIKQEEKLTMKEFLSSTKNNFSIEKKKEKVKKIRMNNEKRKEKRKNLGLAELIIPPIEEEYRILDFNNENDILIEDESEFLNP